MKLRIFLEQLFDFFAGQQYGGVIFIAHKPAYLGGRHLRVFSGQIHTKVPGQGYRPVFFGRV